MCYDAATAGGLGVLQGASPLGETAQDWIWPSLFEAAPGQLGSLRARNASRSDAGEGSNPVSRTIWVIDSKTRTYNNERSSVGALHVRAAHFGVKEANF